MAELNMEAERAAFEAWARDTDQGYASLKGTDAQGGWYYFEDDAQAAWSAWQAARRTAPVSAPIVEELPALPDGDEACMYVGYCIVIPREEVIAWFAPYAERIRQLERDLKQAKLQEIVDIAQECDMGYGKPAERKTASIGDDPKFQELLEEYDDAASHTAILHSLNALITYIDGRTAGIVPDDPLEIGNRMATTLEVLATALKNPGTAEGVRRTVEEWRAAAPTPNSGKEEAND
jgi:hypothetical protein